MQKKSAFDVFKVFLLSIVGRLHNFFKIMHFLWCGIFGFCLLSFPQKREKYTNWDNLEADSHNLWICYTAGSEERVKNLKNNIFKNIKNNIFKKFKNIISLISDFLFRSCHSISLSQWWNSQYSQKGVFHFSESTYFI